MDSLRTLTRWLDFVSEWTGRMVSWLTLAMVLVMFVVVMLRYLFNMGWIAMQESVTYMHAMVFMLGAAYALKGDGHVRVDILYRPMGVWGKAWVDLLGTIFLLIPVTVFIGWISWEYVAAAWQMREGSREAGGLELVWLLKGVILLMPVMVLLQGLSMGCRALVTLLEPSRD